MPGESVFQNLAQTLKALADASRVKVILCSFGWGVMCRRPRASYGIECFRDLPSPRVAPKYAAGEIPQGRQVGILFA